MKPVGLGYLWLLIIYPFQKHPLAMLSGIFLVLAATAAYILWRSLRTKRK